MPRRTDPDMPPLTWRPSASWRLTERETTCLQLLAKGHAVREIAEHLHLSSSMAKTHLSAIYAKFQARNGAHAVAIAYELGLLAPLDSTAYQAGWVAAATAVARAAEKLAQQPPQPPRVADAMGGVSRG